VAELGDAYVFLRDVEHRLQYRDDAQTHELPADAESRSALARACGFADGSTFAFALGRHRDAVDRHFDALFGDADDEEEDAFAALCRDPVDNALHGALLEDAGFADPPALLAQLTRVRNSARYMQLPPASRRRFDALLPQLLRVAGQTGQPQAVFIRLLVLLDDQRTQCLSRASGRASAGASTASPFTERKRVGRGIPDAASYFAR
jgi:glutamate-ammonia-ligase adenylyltransferase